ncbi:MAG TPA: extensin family protein [Ensifer sp.]|jgi:hypothetical protein|uniref:extensin-like domain-containing protein n=1 Tax=Ensifer sp. TaxID=1872086 RepID=UPI002E0D51BC|nr:extensin family protein [Ensifer sp.]
MLLCAAHLGGVDNVQARDRARSTKFDNPGIVAPLPPRRPVELTLGRPEQASTPTARTTPAPAEPEGLIGPPACFATFFERGGIALPAASESGSGACTIAEPVTFRAISMPDGSKTELDSAITVTCAFAVEILDWVREDLPGIVAREDGKLTRLAGVGGHACRPRNGVAGAQISEHATGNALDLFGLRLADGRTVSLVATDTATRSLRESLKTSACARFRTVLGPGSDPSHKDHLHLDMRQRPRDYKICQWNIE